MECRRRYYLKKRQRISRKQDFQSILQSGCCAKGRWLRLFGKPNDLPFCRFGVSVSKKCGKAVVRNRLKRLCREVFRLHQHQLPAGWDYVALWACPQPTDKKKWTYSTVEQMMLKLWAKLHNNDGQKSETIFR